MSRINRRTSLEASGFAVPSEFVLQLLAESSYPVYDCEFIALAQAEDV
jgi:hypothetical protein